MPRTRLSLCMIVRDEAAMLPGFLAAADGLWDELIAVDTGSTDETVELLEDAGATVRRFEWCDDFAAARNESIRDARGEWILYLDADERVTPALAASIGKLLEDERAGAATVLMRNRIPGGQHRLAPLLRLFRNDPGIRFEHRIHEDASASVQAMLEREGRLLRHLEGEVDHLGYVRETAADRGKKGRDEKLLRRALQDDPEDFYCRFKLLELARFWEDKALWKESARNTDQTLGGASEAARAMLRAAHWGGELLALTGQGLHDDPEKELEWLDRRAELILPSAAWHLRRGFCLESLGQSGPAAAAFEDALATARSQTSPHLEIRPLLGLCRLAAAAGDAKQAADLARQAAQAGPLDPEALLALAAFCAPPAGVALSGHETRLLAAHPAAAVPLARALVSAGRIAGAVECLRAPAAEDPEAALGLLMGTMILGEPLDLQLDVSREEADRLFRDWVGVLVAAGHPAPLRDFLIASPTVSGAFPWLQAYLEESLKP